MKVAGVQCDIAWEDAELSLRRIEPWFDAAAAQQVRLLVLPEMFATGFSMDVPKLAAAASHIERRLRELARHHRMAVVAGVADATWPWRSMRRVSRSAAIRRSTRFRSGMSIAIIGAEKRSRPSRSRGSGSPRSSVTICDSLSCSGRRPIEPI